MMNCPKCQFENPPSAKFCSDCGTRFGLVCTNCGTRLPAEAKFCFECGTPVAEAAAPPAPEPGPERAPDSYTPRHLVEKILTSRGALEGERKQVTVLFADVKESMALAEQVDPETWHKILDDFFAILSSGVHRFEGTVNQYTGDGIMALFGAPIAHEDHAQRACFAALQLSEELEEYAENLRRTRGLNFSVRMGLNSGEVVVGSIGDDLRMDYTAKGHTVGLAARMEQLAAPGKAYLTDYTAALVSGYFDLRDLGVFDVKGVSRPTRVHELVGVGSITTRLEVSQARGFSRFVGRDEEFATLERALEQVSDGGGRVVGVVAEAGAGKSRLCYEFARHCRTRGISVSETHCVPHGKMIPFLPVVQLLRSFFEIEDADGDRKAREKVAGKLLLLDDTLKEALPFVFDFMGILGQEKLPTDVPDDARRKLLYRCLERMFECNDDCTPEVLVFEDLHWLDEGSAGFLTELVELIPRTRTLLLLNFRPEFQAPWMAEPAYEQISLLPLGPQAIVDLLEDLLGEDPTLEGLAGRISEHTAGNPFFMEEVVQAMVESGTLEGTRGHYRLTAQVGEIVIPATVQGVISARVDRLGEREKQLLDKAAVIGKEFPAELLAQVSELSEEELLQGLQALVDAGFLYEQSVYPSREYAFKHPLTQEVTYNSQLHSQRADVHRALAEVLARECNENCDEALALTAHHWSQAGDALQAARWWSKSAGVQSTRNALEALRQWRQVRELADALEETEEAKRLGLEARLGILSECWKADLQTESLDGLLAEGTRLAEDLGDTISLAKLTAAYATAINFSGQIQESLTYLAKAAELAQGSDDDELRLNLMSRLAYSNLLAGHLHESLHLSEAVAEEAADPLSGQAMKSYPLMYMGRFDEAAAALQSALSTARGDGQFGYVGMILGTLTTLDWFLGDSRQALSHAQAQLDLAEQFGSSTFRSTARDSLGIAYVMNGRFDDAIEMFEQALAIVREKATMLQAEPVILCNLSEAYLGAGNRSRAVKTAAEAVAIARERGTRMHQCRALLFHARALLRAEGAKPKAEIGSLLDQAMAIVELTGGRGYEPFIREEMAELYRAAGDMERYRSELETARSLYEQSGAVLQAQRLAALQHSTSAA